jgi:hypothetical protein
MGPNKPTLRIGLVRPSPFFERGFLLVWLGIWWAGTALSQTITTSSWTNQFNSASDAASWQYWYSVFPDYLGQPYSLPMTNDPTMDAQGNPSSGSLILFSPFGQAPRPSFPSQNVVFGTFGGNLWDSSLQIPGTVVQQLSFDVHVKPGTPLSASNNFGGISIALVPPNWDGGTFHHFTPVTVPAVATNGWVHIVETNQQDLQRFAWNYGPYAAGVGIDYNNYSGYPTNDVVMWVDNVAVTTGPAWALPPPPPTSPGLNVLFWMSSQYDREMISAGNVGYSFVGRSDVVYSWTVGTFPSSDHQYCVQFFFLIGDDTGSRGTDTAADWSAPNVIAAVLSQSPSGGATMTFNWKTNVPAANPVFASFGSLTVPSPLGKWSLRFQNTTNVTLSGPNGAMTNFVFPAAAAALFADPMVMFLGGQQNGNASDPLADEGTSVTLQQFNATGIANAFTDSFTNDTSLASPWVNASQEPRDIQFQLSGTTNLPFVPVLNWTNPPSIRYGTALDTNQLNATCSVPGTFTYSPASGTVLNQQCLATVCSA